MNPRQKKAGGPAKGRRITNCLNCNCQLPQPRNHDLLYGFCIACSAQRTTLLAGAAIKVSVATDGKLSVFEATRHLSVLVLCGVSPDLSEAEAQRLVIEYGFAAAKPSAPTAASDTPAPSLPAPGTGGPSAQVAGCPPPIPLMPSLNLGAPVHPSARFHKLRDGSWAVVGDDPQPKRGTVILVRTKRGDPHVVKIGQVEWCGYPGYGPRYPFWPDWQASFTKVREPV